MSLAEKHHALVEQYEDEIEFVADEVGSQGVSELERLSTAVLVTRDPDFRNENVNDRAQKLVELKPHLSREEARRAVE